MASESDHTTSREHPLLVGAARFHGHIGPYLALGLRMGFLANERLGREPLEAEAVVTVEAKPPRACILDGIQYATGCTLGKGNIKVEHHASRIAADFTLGGESVKVTIRREFLVRMERELAGRPEKAVVDYAFKIMDTAAVDLFEVT
jgi:formylmethanofuran dehydrogenase subunit E